jgi:hypothetical protein
MASTTSNLYYFIVSPEALHGITEKQHHAVRFWRCLCVDNPAKTYSIDIYERQREGHFVFQGKWDPELAGAAEPAPSTFSFEDLLHRSAC